MPVDRQAAGQAGRHVQDGQSEAKPAQSPERTHRVGPMQHAVHLAAHPLPGHLGTQRRVDLGGGGRLLEVRRQAEPQPSGQPHRPQRPQRVIQQRLHRGQRRACDARTQVLQAGAPQMVLHTAGVQVVEQRVERQISPPGVLLRAAEGDGVRDAAALRVRLGAQVHQVQPGAVHTQRRRLQVLALLRVRLDDAHAAGGRAGGGQVLVDTLRKLAARHRVQGDVNVVRLPPQQLVPHPAASHTQGHRQGCSTAGQVDASARALERAKHNTPTSKGTHRYAARPPAASKRGAPPRGCTAPGAGLPAAAGGVPL